MTQVRLPEDAVFESPLPCDFKVGDPVVFTNDYGVQFEHTVLGFAAEPNYGVDPTGEPRFIYIFTDAWWYPVAASSLRLKTFRKDQGIF